MALIELNHVHKDYWLGKVTVNALIDINLKIDSGSFITVMGPSGSGKSTLLNLIGLLDYADRGEVYFDGQIIDSRDDKRLTFYRREYFGFIFQSFNLIPILNVEENIMYPLLNSKIRISERKNRVYKLLEMVGLNGMHKRFPNELSGGQQQRVAIARALVRSPRVILADEPTANLDSETGKMIVQLLHDLNRDENITHILATHDREIIKNSDLILNLVDGRIKEGPHPCN